MVMVEESQIRDLKDKAQDFKVMARLAHLLSIMEDSIMKLQGEVFQLQEDLDDEKRKSSWLEIELQASRNSLKKCEEQLPKFGPPGAKA
jgi:hypothetical protein